VCLSLESSRERECRHLHFSLVPSLSIKLKDAAKDRSELELAPPQEEGDGQRNVEGMV